MSLRCSCCENAWIYDGSFQRVDDFTICLQCISRFHFDIINCPKPRCSNSTFRRYSMCLACEKEIGQQVFKEMDKMKLLIPDLISIVTQYLPTQRLALWQMKT